MNKTDQKLAALTTRITRLDRQIDEAGEDDEMLRATREALEMRRREVEAGGDDSANQG